MTGAWPRDEMIGRHAMRRVRAELAPAFQARKRGALVAARVVGLACVILLAGCLHAEEDVIPMPTLGGMQFWGDELFFHQWRIQRHVTTGHCRLLDPHGLRYAWGSLDECRQTLEKIKRQRELPPMQGKAVVVLHSMGHSRATMDSLCKYLRRHGKFEVFNVSYPSTRQEIALHARALASIVENLDGIEEISFVAHSLGNIVVRHYLGDQTDQAAGRRPDPRIRRMVMIGAPNQGSIAAAALADNELFMTLTGRPGQQLGVDWPTLERRLVIPSFEFGVVAGGLGNDHGINPLLPGDNDGVVTVAGTRLPGARDFLRVPVMHPFLVTDAKVQQATLQFLEHGYFVSEEKRNRE